MSPRPLAGVIGVAIGWSRERRDDDEVRDLLELQRKVLMQRASVTEHRLFLVARF